MNFLDCFSNIYELHTYNMYKCYDEILDYLLLGDCCYQEVCNVPWK
jgi:hypothetical protein